MKREEIRDIIMCGFIKSTEVKSMKIRQNIYGAGNLEDNVSFEQLMTDNETNYQKSIGIVWGIPN